MVKNILTYRLSFLHKALLLLGLFLALGNTNAVAQFAITENFRGSGNPDIVIGGGTPAEGTAYLTSGINDPVNAGWLRLTKAVGYQKGYAYVNESFPSTLGVLVDFEYKMWRSTSDTYNGADGIGVFLYDANATFALGGYGGSLGYAPNGGSGLAGGYVGVGLDAYGNYSNASEGRIGGPGVRPNAIVLRGPTTSTASTTNRFLAGKTITTTDGVNFTYSDVAAVTGNTAQNALDYNSVTTTRPTDAQFYRRVQLEITRLDAAGIYYNVIVRWKTSPTGNFVYVTDYTTTDVPPGLLKLGFAASTGGGINNHEIRNLLVTTPGNLRILKRADKDILRTNNAANGTITYTIEVTNDTGFEIPQINFTDRITDSYGNLMPEGITGFDITSITTSGFVTASMSDPATLTTNEISGTLVLAANTTAYITIVGRLYAQPNGSILQNTASAIPPLDDDLNNNTSIVRTPVTAENVDLLLTKMVTEQCITSPTVPKFTVYVSNNGAVATSFTRLGINGTRVAFYNIVPPGYTYDDSSTPDGFAGTQADPLNSDVTAKWSKIVLNNSPSAGYTTIGYIARGTDVNGASQSLGSGATYPYPVTYTMQPPTGTTSYTDTSTALLFTDYNYGLSIETPENQANNNASINMYIKPAAPTVPAGPLNYCVDEDAPELTATATGTNTLRWYMTANGFSSEFPIKPYTGASGTYTYYVSQVNGDCEGPQTPITVIVGPADTGTITAPATICPGSTVAVTGTAVTGATYAWQSATEGGTFTTISGATGQNYTSGALTETMYFRRLVTLTANGKTCTGPGNFVKVFIASPGIIGNSQSACADFDPVAFTNVTSGTNGTINGVTYSYQWQRSNNGTTGWTDINGATGSTYDSGNLTATRYFRRVVVYNTCSSVSNVVVAFRGTGTTPDQGGIGSDQTICNGDTPAALTASGTPGAGYFQWEYSTTSATAGFTIIPDASPTSGVYSPGPLTVTTWYRRTRISGCGTPTGVTVKITVLNPTPGTIGTTKTICYNTLPGTLSSVANGAGLTYRWEVAEGTSGGSYSTISGATGATYTPGALTTSKRYRRINISTSLIPLITCESVPSNIVTIIVKPQTDQGTITGAQNICSGGTASPITGTAASSVDPITYLWQVSATSGGTYAAATGTNNQQNYTPTVTGYYRRRTTTTCGNFDTNIVYVSFQPAISAGTITAPAATTICYNAAPAQITGSAVTPATGTTITYRWESSANAAGPFATAAGTSNGQNYTSPALTATTYFRRIAISTLNGNACESPATTPVMITVQDNVGVGSISGPAIGCNGTSVTIASDVAGTGSGTITYRWESSNTPTGTFAVITGETGPTLTINPFTATRSYRRYTISTQNTVACTAGPTNVVTVTYQTLPTGGVIAATANRVCPGGTTVINNNLSGGNFTSYQWQYSTTGSPFNWIDIPGATGAAYTTFPLTATTYFQRLAINQCGSSTSGDIHIDVTIVNPGTIGPDKTICNNTSPGALGGSSAGTANVGTITYRWESAAGATGGTFAANGQTGQSYTPGNLTSTIRYRRYTISTSGGVACEAFAEILVTVQTVPAAASITAPSSTAVCSGANVTIGSGGVGTGDGTITYRWEAAPTATNVYATVSGQTGPTLTVNNITASTSFRRYTVSTVNGVGCESVATNVITISVMPIATGGQIGTSQIVCSGNTPPNITNQTAGTNANQGYVWQTSTDNVTWITQSQTSPDYFPSGPITVTTYYRRFGISNQGIACTGTDPSNTVVMTVPVIVSAGSIGADQTVCGNALPALLTSVTPGAGTGYQWQVSNNGSSSPSDWSNITGATGATYQPPASYTLFYRRLTLYSTSCTSPSNVVKITVTGSLGAGSIAANQSVCNNAIPATLTSPDNGYGGNFRWDSSTDGITWTSTGVTTATYTFSAALPATRYYRRAIVGTSCSGEVYSNTVTITVTAPPGSGGTIAAAQTICYGATPAALTSTAPGSVTTYRWDSSANGTTWSAATGTNNAAGYTPGALTATTYYRRATVSGSCEVYSNTIIITVLSQTTAGALTANQSICRDTAPAQIGPGTAGAGSGTITYRWESSPDGSTGWTVISGATGASYTPLAIHSTTYYRRITISTTGSVICESVATGTVIVTTRRCYVTTNPHIQQKVKS